MTIILTYDISDPKRLRKIAKICEKYLVRVQKSVFEGEIGKSEMHCLQEDIKRAMEKNTDSVFIYNVPRISTKSKNVMGKEMENPFHIF